MFNGKQCTLCKQKLSRSDFHKDVSNLDGLKYACRECRNEQRRAWYKENSEKEQARLKESSAKNKHKGHARKLVNAAQHLNLIEHSDHCQLCGVVGQVEGHHPDYSEPHCVIWLCSTCHRQHHHHERVMAKVESMNPRGSLGRQVLNTLRKTYANYLSLQRRTLSRRIRIPNTCSNVQGGTHE